MSESALYEIRRMWPSDYPVVRALIRQLSKGEAESTPTEVERWLASDQFHPRVLLLNGLLVAYAELHVLPHWGRGSEGRIERVVTDANYQRRGFGDALQTHLIELARQLGCARIELRVENPRALEMYKKHGFEVVEDAHVCVLSIQP